MADLTDAEILALVTKGISDTGVSPVEIPTFTGEPLYRIRVTLDGREYLFEFDWNDREQRYYLSIGDIDETWIVRGMKLVSNWHLLRKCTNLIKPPGILMAVSLSDDAPPTINDLGIRVKLMYIPTGLLPTS